MRTNQIAINSVSTKADSMEQTLAAYAAASFRQVEFAIPQIKEWLGEGRTVADFKALLDQHALRCVGGFEAVALCFADEAERAANHDLHVPNAELLDELGGGVLVVGSDGPPEPSVEALSVVGRTLRGLIERFPPSVSIAVEFNWSPLIRSLRGAASVAEAADHPRVGILFDLAHYHCTASKFEDLTEQVVGRILHVHVDDMRDKPGDLCNCNSDRVLPGEGCLDVAGILGHLEQFGYTGNFAIEMFNDDLWAKPAEEAAKLMYDSMARLCDGG